MSMARRKHKAEAAATRPTQGSLTLKLSACVLLLTVYWLLFAGRWGAYVGVPRKPIYITDMLLALSALLLLPAMPQVVGRFRSTLRTALGVSLAALFLWAAVRLVVDFDFSRLPLRDAAPFIYIGTAGLALANGAVALVRDWHFYVLSCLHAAWVFVSIWIGSAIEDLPQLGPIHLFTPRPDFDGAVCGLGLVLAVFYALTVRSVRSSLAWIPVGLANGYLVVNLDNRAALLGTLVAACVVGFAATRQALRSTNLWHRRRPRTAILSILVLGMIGLVFAAGQSSTGRKIIATLDGDSEARGTVNARAIVYEMVFDATNSSVARSVAGVGFGRDYLEETGADEYFEGETYSGVRSPHNAFLNTWARLGLIGLTLQLLGAVCAISAGTAVLRRSIDGPADPLVACTALVIILPVTALFGVILESPFGAVPYYSAVGLLLAATSGQVRSRHGLHRQRTGLLRT